jgi:hypothetical protein
MFYYLNEDHSVRVCSSDEWSNQFEEMRRKGTHHVACDQVGKHSVSTVFLGNNHNLYLGKPLIFETMVFAGDSAIDDYCERYSTWDEAIEGHKKAIEWAKKATIK